MANMSNLSITKWSLVKTKSPGNSEEFNMNYVQDQVKPIHLKLTSQPKGTE